MNIADVFNQAICFTTFRAPSAADRYAKKQVGPFMIMRYVPKNVETLEALPAHVYVNEKHEHKQAALSFIEKNNRAVRRARERGTRVG